MFSLSLLSLVLTAAEPATPSWHKEYAAAYKQARETKKDLFIYFRQDDTYDDVFEDPDVKEGLKEFVCVRIPTDYEHKGETLLNHDSFEDMMGYPGMVVVSLHDPDLPFYQEIVSAHPFVRSRYGWAPAYGAEQVKMILELPAHATLTQRSMIYAIRVHPEQPRSINAECHPAFLGHAERHSRRQARMLHQHHADILSASYQMSQEVGGGVGPASEVVAESWGRVVGGENVLEAAFSCIDAWRHSSGHWGAVSRTHRYFGYDLARGENGTWYATGIFAD
ncbi:hypothetical protein AYO40_03010 [Planctomycetaceae bacterium SCGC AG-212-D15]|nr:hypothetical protein AYO40_03010 [Planctomycetaceae bacterium SCGC AG-212-D15]